MKKIVAATVLASASLFALSAPALAQDNAPADAAVEEEGSDGVIIVQARRRDEDAQDVPVVVNPVTAETIEKLNLRKFEDIASVVPGLALQANQNGIGAVATVRGINFDVNVSGNNGTVQFYQNDVPIPAGLLFNSLFDVGQIEVLRGPQGTLKGRSSPSGSITLYTRRPDLSEVGGNAELTVNDLNGYQTKGALNIPIIAGKLGVRIAGVVSDGRGNRVRDLVNTTDLNDETRGIRASAKADPFDGVLELDFTFQNLKREVVAFGQSESASEVIPGAFGGPVLIRARDRRSAVGTPLANDQSFRTYDWQAKLSLVGQQLTYVGGRATQTLQAFAPTDIGGVFVNDFSGANQFGQLTNTFSKNTSHEARLQNQDRVAGMFDYVVGALFAKGSSVTNFGSVTGIALAPPFSNPPRLVNIAITPINRFGANKETSFFGNLTAHIGEQFELSGGVRRIKYEDASGLAVNGVVNPLFARNVTERKTIYQASAKYQVTPDLMVYASTGSSFRPSTVAIGGPTARLSALQASFLGTPAETSKSYEVGVKSDFLDDTVRFNLTGYYQKFQNYPFRSASGVAAIDRTNSATGTVTAFNYVAAVPVKVRGVEAELSFTPSERFSIGGILSYAKGKISNGIVPCLDIDDNGIPDTTGQPSLAVLEADVGANNIDSCPANFNSTLAPRWSGSVRAEYGVPLSNGVDAYLRGLFSYKGRSDNDPVNSFDNVKAFGLLNLYAGVRDPDGAWEVSLFGKNIANTFRVLRRSNGVAFTPLRGGIPLGGPVSSSGPLSNGYFSGSNDSGLGVTEPREFGINLRIAFGGR